MTDEQKGVRWTVFAIDAGGVEQVVGAVVAETYEEAWTKACEQYQRVSHVCVPNEPDDPAAGSRRS